MLATIYGLHPLDAAVVIVSLVAVLAIGVYVSRGVKGENDFFVSGKSMGPWLQFFLNFGQATDSNGAPTIATEVYRQGVGGMWIGFQTLFITPFIWFTSIWFRRSRVITGPDLFISRFNSPAVATMYAFFALLTVPLSLGLGNIISYKVAAAMLVKPETEYTTEDHTRVNQFAEFRALKKAFESGTLVDGNRARYEQLNSMAQKGLIDSRVSYIKPLPFYIAYTLIVAVYIMLGGIKAAAITDAFQGLLIIIFSVMMIPLGLHHVGGFSGLHGKVPEHFFLLFGSESMSEYTWYTILAIVLASLVVFGMPGGPANAAARDERSARIGTLSGVFLKRFVMIAWMICGLLAVATLPNGLSDPDETWGALAATLLFPGLMGLMIAGMLLGHMPAVGVAAVNFSATFTRNIYEPLVRERSAKHYMFIAQLSIFLVLVSGVLFAMLFSGVIALLSAMITFNTFFGAAGFLMYFWRRLTVKAVMIGAAIWLVSMTVVAWGLPHAEWFRSEPSLLLQSSEQVVSVKSTATAADVAAGKAKAAGDIITKQRRIEPKPVFFERIARSDDANPNSPLVGFGRFHIENYTLHLLGVPMQKFGPAGLVTARWLFSGFSPFVILMVISYLTWRKPEGEIAVRTARFYARQKTPIKPTAEADAEEVGRSDADPTRFDHLKLFPRTLWEFTKWDKADYLGFFGCWAGVLAILLMLWGILQIGA